MYESSHSSTARRIAQRTAQRTHFPYSRMTFPCPLPFLFPFLFAFAFTFAEATRIRNVVRSYPCAHFVWLDYVCFCAAHLPTGRQPNSVIYEQTPRSKYTSISTKDLKILQFTVICEQTKHEIFFPSGRIFFYFTIPLFKPAYRHIFLSLCRRHDFCVV